MQTIAQDLVVIPLIHTNANLSEGQKLHYLQNCLKGNALDLVSSFVVCDSNNAEVRGLLMARYKVMRVTVDSHIKTIMSIGTESIS